MIKAIIAILEKIGCKHDWDLRIEQQVRTGWGGEYTAYTFICNKCGKFKRWKSS